MQQIFTDATWCLKSHLTGWPVEVWPAGVSLPSDKKWSECYLRNRWDTRGDTGGGCLGKTPHQCATVSSQSPKASTLCETILHHKWFGAWGAISGIDETSQVTLERDASGKRHTPVCRCVITHGCRPMWWLPSCRLRPRSRGILFLKTVLKFWHIKPCNCSRNPRNHDYINQKLHKRFQCTNCTCTTALESMAVCLAESFFNLNFHMRWREQNLSRHKATSCCCFEMKLSFCSLKQRKKWHLMGGSTEMWTASRR